MIDEKAILSLADKLETAVDLLVHHTPPPEGWASEMKWAIYDVHQDIEKGRLDFQGLVPEAEVKELKQRIYDLENEVEALEDQLDQLPDQDEFNELESENEDLRGRIRELEGKKKVEVEE